MGRMEIWALNYRLRQDPPETMLRVMVFESEKKARDYMNFPDAHVKVVGRPWNLLD